MSAKDVLLIPGAWHDGSCFDLIRPPLQSQGFSVKALTLPSVTKPSSKSFQEDVNFIRAEVQQFVEDGKSVAIVMHSYGGIPGCEALQGLCKAEREAKGLQGGVVALVFLASWMVNVGESVFSLLGGIENTAPALKEEDGCLHVLIPKELFYNDLESDEAEKWITRLKPHAAQSLASPLSYAAYKHIPTTYLTCQNDKTIPYQLQLQMIQAAGDSIQVETFNSGHSPFLSQPEMTVDVIIRAVSKYF